MNDKLRKLIRALLVLIGIGILVYPSLSQYLHQKNTSHVIASYNDVLSTSDDRKIESIFNAASDYNSRLRDKPHAFFDPSIISGMLIWSAVAKTLTDTSINTRKQARILFIVLTVLSISAFTEYFFGNLRRSFIHTQLSVMMAVIHSVRQIAPS